METLLINFPSELCGRNVEQIQTFPSALQVVPSPENLGLCDILPNIHGNSLSIFFHTY